MDEQSTDSSRRQLGPDSSATLDLLRLLEQHPDYSQRQLSVALGVSVGKVHYLLRALLDRGLVKAKNFQRSNNKLGYLYVLTPSGVRQRWQLTRHFLASREADYVALTAQIAALRDEVAAAESGAVTPVEQ